LAGDERNAILLTGYQMKSRPDALQPCIAACSVPKDNAIASAHRR
jgi:hypothetical protein